jgi:hypothetical protein
MTGAEELKGSVILMYYLSKEFVEEWRRDVMKDESIGEDRKKELMKPQHNFRGVVFKEERLYCTGKQGKVLGARVEGKELEPRDRIDCYLVKVDDVKGLTLYGSLSQYWHRKTPLNQRVEVRLESIEDDKDLEGKEVMFLGPVPCIEL